MALDVCLQKGPKWLLQGLAMCLAAVCLQAQPTLVVKGSDGTVLNQYRWVLEEDRTYHVDLDKADQGFVDRNMLALGFHASYMPVVDKGDDAQGLPVLDPAKYYFVSVMPKAAGTYSIGGAQITPGQTGPVTVVLNKLPLPLAQITIFVYHDIAPVNNIPDLPEEVGLPGFSVVLEDAGGRYGASAGTQTMDAYGNKLGTVYVKCTNPTRQTCDPNNVYQVDAEGAPIIATDKAGNPIVEPLVSGPCPGDQCGLITIKNLTPSKYGVIISPPPGEVWQQTATIEGTKVIDAWVKPNEPPFFAEFGPAGWHTDFGFVKQFTDATVLKGGPGSVTLRGKVVNNRLSRPPDYAFYNGAPFEHTTPWVALNDNGGQPGLSRGVFAAPTEGGDFVINNVPPGSYQLGIWDANLDLVFAAHTFIVNNDGTCNTPGGSCDFGEVPVFNWFAAAHHYVFDDVNQNGKRDAGELGLPDVAVNFRWRDGSLYQTMPTDSTGFAPLDEVFPFFHWLVAEVDFTRYKATGLTVTVDDGGPADATDPATFDGILNPQLQCPEGFWPAALTVGNRMCTNGADVVAASAKTRTEVGPVLTQGFQGFLGQTSVFEWGKTAYTGIENGGISGVVYYDTTRAEDDPKENAPEPWQPGIPGITVKLYDAAHQLIFETQTDSWDDAKPEGCMGETFIPRVSAVDAAGNPILDANGNYILEDMMTDCYDGLRSFNQVRPGVFDGGYAFTECFPDSTDATKCALLSAVAPGTLPMRLPAGQYFVEVVPPMTTDGRLKYDIVKEEDKNVDFGDTYTPSPQLQVWPCTGDPVTYGYSSTVPDLLTLFPDSGIAPARAGLPRTLCNEKQVSLSNGANAAADFFLFTEVPIAGHFVGMILDDMGNEFDPTSPNFGEKYAPPYLPVSIRDWTGREIGRVHADKFGRYNALVPSTYTANQPKPSGMDPNMLVTCMNARNLPGGGVDQFHNPAYSEFCYVFQYMPGTTTYLDTPVVPVSAFAGPNQNQLDCELPDGTPRVSQVSVPANGLGGGPVVTAANQIIEITSFGTVNVPNPAYCPGPPFTTSEACPVINTQKTILRDYGFGSGTPPVLTIGGVNVPINNGWTPTLITANVPAGVSGQLVVTRGDNGRETVNGITVHANPTGTIRLVTPGAGAIQAAIDAAKDGDMILVGPGTYDEMVIMWKPVKLQGWGEGVTKIDAVKIPAEKLQAWRNKVASLVAGNQVTLLDGQQVAVAGIEPGLLQNEEGSGILVLPKKSKFSANLAPRIDGFSISGADTGGGIVVNGWAEYLQITNNRVSNNNGSMGGGIRIGHPLLTSQNDTVYTDAGNDFVKVRNNIVTQNGGLGGAGGGISVCTGADAYEVTGNWVCGNYSTGDGGGIAHLGLSRGGLISENTVLFNENFNQMQNVSGGGILVAGQPALLGQTYSPGSGSVAVSENLILGNSAGGDGGGISALRVNGRDVFDNRTRPDRWYKLELVNNIIANNVAAMRGAGISLQDVEVADILHNTIAHNDSTATSGQAFTPGIPSQSNPQPAGIVTYEHSAALAGASTRDQGFANPRMVNNIVWGNRSFYFLLNDTNPDAPIYTLEPSGWSDMAVISPVPRTLTCTGCLLTDPNTAGNGTAGLFVAGYFNAQAGVTVAMPEAGTTLTPPPAFDEGGNFIRVRFGPLSLLGNYHLLPGSAAVDAASGTVTVPVDFDGDVRPQGTAADIGADETAPAAAQTAKK